MTLTYTKYYRFPKTDFMSEPWIQGIWDSFDAIDALMYSQAAANGTTVWLNSTQYGPGRTVIDVTDGSTWICTTAHTSAAVPTSFAQDRTANPSFWTAIMLSIQVRGQWRNNTAYNSGDMVYDTTAGRNIQALCVTKHISNAAGTINDDAAYWGFTYNSLAPTTASGIGYSNAASHLVAVNVQTAIDEVVAVKAPINSPAFTGAPTAPTPVPPNTNNNYIATTAFVTSQLSSQTSAALPAMDGVASAGALATFSRGDHVHPTDTSRAPLASPAFTGIPTAPTVALVIDATTKVATTAFVQNAIVGITGGGSIPPPSGAMPLMDATPGVVGVSPAYTREDHVHPTDTSRAALASPAFTGTPTAPTPIAGDNSTKVATTAFSAVNEVRTDIVQALTAAQQVQARQNIYAAPFDAMSYNGMQINGGADVSQENGNTQIYGGAGGTPIGKYIADGWIVQSGGVQSISWAQSNQAIGPAPGYRNYVGVWSNEVNTAPASGDYLFMSHMIEGYRIARLAWGTGNAQPLAIGFWFASSRTGTYSGSVCNGAHDRSYVFTFPVNAVNTWEWKTLTIPGDATGTWNTTNGGGIQISFTMMCGASLQTAAGVWTAGNYIGANGTINAISTTPINWDITGLIVLPGLELPSAARAPLIMRPYDQELLTCKRYYAKPMFSHRFSMPSQYGETSAVWPVEMRAIPTITLGGFGPGGAANNMAANSPVLSGPTTIGARFALTGAAVNTDTFALNQIVILDARM